MKDWIVSRALGRVVFLRLPLVSLSTVLFVFAGACVSIVPVEEYNIARVAIESAKDSEAARFAPALWYKAELAYREGESLFRERDYKQAKRRFEAARAFAEQAENAARLGRNETGEVTP